MGAPVVHFEVTGKDGPALQRFYSDVFGWSLDTNNPGGYGFYRPAEGIGGGIGATQDGSAGHVTFYVHAEDPAAVLREVEARGRHGDHAVDRSRSPDDDRAVRRSRGARRRARCSSPRDMGTPPARGRPAAFRVLGGWPVRDRPGGCSG